MANGRIAGICYVKVDGEQLEITGGLECPVLDVKREAVMGLAGVAGYKESALEPFIKGTFAYTEEFPLETLQTNTEMTITAELANGRVYTLSGAYVRGEPSVKGDEGTIDLEFGGKRGQWQ